MSDYQHWPAFEKLCDLAEKSGLQVRLPATEQALAERPGEECRQLVRIEMWLMGAQRTEQPVASASIYDEDLEAAALDLLLRVG